MSFEINQNVGSFTERVPGPLVGKLCVVVSSVTGIEGQRHPLILRLKLPMDNHLCLPDECFSL